MKTKRILAALAAAAMCISLTACGGENGNAGGAGQQTGAVDATAQVTEAVKKLNAAKSVQMKSDFNIGMEMSAAGQSQEMTTKIITDMEMIQQDENNVKLKGSLSTDMGEMGSQNVELYATVANNQMTLYMNAADQWIQQQVDESQMGTYNPMDSLDMYLGNAVEFVQEDKETVDGVEATRYKGVIKNDKLADVIQSSGLLTTFEQYGADAENLPTLLKEAGDIDILVWLDAQGYPVKYEMDLAGMLNVMFAEAVKAAGEAAQGLEMKATAAHMVITCAQFDQIADFEIPAEALEAPVV